MFIFFCGVASAQNYNEYDELDLNVTLNTTIDLNFNHGYNLEYVYANVSFFPKEGDFIIVNSMNLFSYPDTFYDAREDSIYYEWDEFSTDKLRYGFVFDLDSEINFKKVYNKIKFPLSNQKEFLKPTQLIQSDNNKILNQATQIAEGENDLYQVVHKLAEWVNENIDYNLDTLTAEVTQDSVWVLEHREGVCDELTVLFVAMTRSLGIPTKFVSGLAYTNIDNSFGGHSWAEVYFPEIGWVPFDITYGQYGYVDPTHIKMKEGLDAKDSSVNYAWKTQNVEVDVGEINFDVNVTNVGNKFRFPIDFDLELLVDKVGKGSYIPIKVDVENLEKYYVPVSLYITKAPSALENNFLTTLLAPNQKKSIFKIIKIPSDLEEGYTYKAEIEISDGEISKKKILNYGLKYDAHTLEQAEEKIKKLEGSDKASYSSNLNFECELDKNEYLVYEKAKISCLLTNLGTINLKNLNICFEDKCENADLPIAQKKEIIFEFSLEDHKSKELVVKVENEDIIKYSYLTLNVFETPGLEINNLVYPDNVNYNEEYEISFDLEGETLIKNVNVYLNGERIFNFETFEGSQELLIPFKGKFFYNRDDVAVRIIYEDANGKVYETNKKVIVDVLNAPWYADILSWLH